MSHERPPILCFSHLRWNFVYQRPQHIISRMAEQRPIAFIEEPEVGEGTVRYRSRDEGGVTVITPIVPEGATHEQSQALQRSVVDAIVDLPRFRNPVLWYYTPMALPFTAHLEAQRIYDCMDELSMFKDAPPSLIANERALLRSADVVFTGGRSLYYAKRRLHANVHCFPSAVDAAHFAAAGRLEPEDMAHLKRPRIGFYGVIDERFDIDYLRECSRLLPDFEFAIIGPVVKIAPEALPQATNIHYLGMKSYAELPAYLEHWDIAFLPFALNDSTRYISPTKTLEYLAAGKPVISTPIADVIDPYGKDGVVAICPSPQDAARIARDMVTTPHRARWKRLPFNARAASWDDTVRRMAELIAAPHAPSQAVAAG